jgi:4-amino-4-deoxychorismate lyase
VSATTRVNGVDVDHVSVLDRGLAYGDGVFETLLIADGRAVWWDAHLARMRRGCERLGFEMPGVDLLAQECAGLVADRTRAVLKIIVTRGDAGRGYGAPEQTHPTRIVTLHPAPNPEARDCRDGIAVHECATRLAIQPRLAGIKHLNRLEQVLARSEWREPSLREGLMRDTDGRPVCATAANLFVVRGGRLSTPSLTRCGVEGTARAWILMQADVVVRDLDWDELADADELFLASSLRGILPIARFGGRCLEPGSMTRALQQTLWREVPALAPAPERPA